MSRQDRMRLRDAVIAARRKYQRGQATLAEVYAAADAYIAAIKAWGKEQGRKVPVPTRAGLLRMG